MGDFWSKMKTGIKGGASMSANKIEEFSKIGKLKVEQFNIRKKIEETRKDLGIRTYDLIKDDKADKIANDITINDFVKKIDDFEKEIKEIDLKIVEVHDEAILKQKKLQEELEKEKLNENKGDDTPNGENEDEVLGI